MSDFQFFRPPKSIDQVLEKLKAKPASYWEKQGESAILSLFRFTIQTVPAYQKLLQAHNIQHQGIKTLKDFSRLPLIDKNSYLRANDYLDLLPHRSVRSLTTFCATSGSTGVLFEAFPLPVLIRCRRTCRTCSLPVSPRHSSARRPSARTSALGIRSSL